MPNLWIDVEDLFEYARTNTRPSGIQRVEFEICQALHGTGRAHFVRHAPLTNSFTVVTWSEVGRLFQDLTRPDAPPAVAPVPTEGRLRKTARRLLHRLPTAVRIALSDAYLTTGQAIRAWRNLAAVLVAPTKRRPPQPALGQASQQADFTALCRPGDVILVLGSPWFHPAYAGIIHRLRQQAGLRFALLVHDLIPLRRPEWCEATLARQFRAWFIPLLPLCDHIFTVSKATARDVMAYAADQGVSIRPPVPIPLGTGLAAVPGPRTQLRDLPPPGTYALVVSTIEIRKNHLLLFRVWRRLLEDLPRSQVPTLVFAGRIGWMVGDLMEQIRNSHHLEGKLVLVESPTDTELAQLYGGCRFTLFPSFHEGWGLPVTESLSFGKPCLISNATSLPEAGGTLARSFDPDNLHEAYAVIRDTIADPQGLAAWEAKIRRTFKPVPWTESAEVLLDCLDSQPAAPEEVPQLAGARKAAALLSEI